MKYGAGIGIQTCTGAQQISSINSMTSLLEQSVTHPTKYRVFFEKFDAGQKQAALSYKVSFISAIWMVSSESFLEKTSSELISGHALGI